MAELPNVPKAVQDEAEQPVLQARLPDEGVARITHWPGVDKWTYEYDPPLDLPLPDLPL